jgi:hypothetical protein
VVRGSWFVGEEGIHLPVSLFWRGIVLPAVMLVLIIALNVRRGRVRPPERGLLVALWGSTGLLVIYAAITAALLWASETPAVVRQTWPLLAQMSIGAVLSLVLGLGLGWGTRVRGERVLIALVRPPEGFRHDAPRSLPALLLLWIALAAATFAATFGALSALALAR